MPSHTNLNYGIKSTVSQCLALAGVSFVQICIGIQLFSSSIVINALLTNPNDEKEWLTMSSKDVAWFGNLLYLGTPLGCALSTLVLNRLGHIKCMIISNLPFIASHLMMVYAHNINTLYASSVLMGLSIGFASGPFTAYVGEVCEPKLRGALMSCTGIFFYLGGNLNTTTFAITNQWRLAVLINLLIPVLTILILLVIPDSPMWLLTKGKTEKAKHTLGKLRGWIPFEMCSSEFREMVVYSTNGQIIENDTDVYGGGKDESPWRQLLRPEVYRPFRLLMVFFLLTPIMSGELLVYIIHNLQDIDIKWAMKLVFFNKMAGILTVFLVNKLGKRFITLLSFLICAFCYIYIGLIGRFWTNPDQWLMLNLYLISVFVSAFGIMPISWALLTEVFPMKSRYITCSIGSTLQFLCYLFMARCFIVLVNLMDFYNIFTVFGVAGLFGCVYFYFYLPETENRTLKEISFFFK